MCVCVRVCGGERGGGGRAVWVLEEPLLDTAFRAPTACQPYAIAAGLRGGVVMVEPTEEALSNDRTTSSTTYELCQQYQLIIGT